MNRNAAALERCVGSAEDFVEKFWARRPLVHRGDQGFDDLLTLADVDHMLSTMSLRLPAFRLVKDGASLPSSSYTKTGRTGSVSFTGIADPGRIYQHFHDGATIVLQGMHRFWLPLTRFCRQLEMVLGHPTQVNCYVTPAGARGLAVHHDAHDVFVLQLFGRKHWEVFEASSRDAGGAASGTRRQEPSDEPLLTLELERGDCLYMPRGTPHAARAQETISGHLTVGVLNYTWVDLLRELFKMAEEEPTFGERLPVGFHQDPAGFAVEVERRLRDLRGWMEKLDGEELSGRMLRKFLTARPSLLDGSLQDLLHVDSLTDVSRVRRRPDAICYLTMEEGELVAFLGDRELRMPPALFAAMSAVADRDEFEVRELEGLLDPESRLVLVRRLVREGLLEVAVV